MNNNRGISNSAAINKLIINKKMKFGTICKKNIVRNMCFFIYIYEMFRPCRPMSSYLTVYVLPPVLEQPISGLYFQGRLGVCICALPTCVHSQ